ncbi:MAG: 50S ribosomal protein L21e [Candidatus Bilamarchaeaceae archaeon]
MVKQSRGTLSKQTKRLKARKNLTVTEIIRKFKEGDSVVIRAQPVFKGMPNPRYNGKHGIVKELRGNACIVVFKEGGKTRQIISHPVHLQPAK